MSAWRDETPSSFPHLPNFDVRTLGSSEGELVLLRARVAPRLLEDFLEALAELPFPINPQIQHYRGEGSETLVEFPAYESWLPRVRSGLSAAGFDGDALEVTRMMEAIQEL